MGMVKDHGRAEDVTQEVFVSALRRMRETERPIAFKPWIYEIAKNACIDQFRRTLPRPRRSRSRPTRVLSPATTLEGSTRRPTTRSPPTGARQPLRRVRRPVGHAPRDPAAARARGPLLPRDRRAHGHEPPGRGEHAVPRPLAAAEEFDDLVSGARCLRIQDLIATAPGRARHARAPPSLAPRRSTPAAPARGACGRARLRDPHARPAAQARGGEDRGPAAVPDLRALARRRLRRRSPRLRGQLRRAGLDGADADAFRSALGSRGKSADGGCPAAAGSGAGGRHQGRGRPRCGARHRKRPRRAGRRAATSSAAATPVRASMGWAPKAKPIAQSERGRSARAACRATVIASGAGHLGVLFDAVGERSHHQRDRLHAGVEHGRAGAGDELPAATLPPRALIRSRP